MKRLFLFFIMTGLVAGAFAQATATATASANVVTPIGISKTADMSFGNIAVSSVGGTVVLDTNDGTTATGGVTLPATAGTITSASFTVTGETDYTYAITLPTTATITDAVSTETMTLSDFTSSPSVTSTLTGGTETLTVGATLAVIAAQVAGAYTGDFDVTVEYN